MGGTVCLYGRKLYESEHQSQRFLLPWERPMKLMNLRIPLWNIRQLLPAIFTTMALLIRTGKVDEAIEIYQRQYEKWPDDWLTAHSLARAYSAKGDYNTALKCKREALAKAPDNNKGFIEGTIEKLERGEDFNWC